jgi:hypothetical protein
LISGELGVVLWQAVQAVYLFTYEKPQKFFEILSHDRVMDMLE